MAMTMTPGNPERRYVIRVHFSRRGAKEGYPWVVHYRGQCLKATRVYFTADAFTLYDESRDSHHKAFIETYGRLVQSGTQFVVRP